MIVSYTRVLFCHYDRNNLMLYIWSRWGQDAVKRMAVRYGIGTCNFWPGATVFWQRDIDGRFLTGKIMLYDCGTLSLCSSRTKAEKSVINI